MRYNLILSVMFEIFKKIIYDDMNTMENLFSLWIFTVTLLIVNAYLILKRRSII